MAKEGYPFVLFFLIPTIVFAVLQWWVLAVVCLVLTLFMMHFFRDPERTIPTDTNTVVAPADGKITRVIKVEPDNPNSPTLISIFMSPLNVHINRSPIPGVIREVKHTKGRFVNAMSDEASLVNEQNTITLENDRMTVVMKQIAGFIARRCVFFKQPGDRVGLGERVGLIKFSSRTDLILPAEVQVVVHPGERVYGGTTIIGRIEQK